MPRRRREHSEQHGLAFRDHARDDRIGVLRLDVEVDAARAQILRQHVGREARLLLVEVDGHDVEIDRRALAQQQQHVEQAVAVLAAGQADHHLVAVLDHVEVGNGLAGQAQQALLQLDVFARDPVRDGPFGRRSIGVRQAHAASLKCSTSTPTASTSG